MAAVRHVLGSYDYKPGDLLWQPMRITYYLHDQVGMRQAFDSAPTGLSREF